MTLSSLPDTGPERETWGRRLERATVWVIHNLDVLIAIFIALAAVALDVFGDLLFQDDVDGITDSAILLALGALAFVALTERLRRRTEARQAAADLQRRLDNLTMVRPLSGSEVGAALRRARGTTRQWTFKGGTGSYLRPVTLPECVSAARRRRGEFTLHIEIIDPTDRRACAAYAEFRRSFARGRTAGPPGDAWTLERTATESAATVVAACWHRQRLSTLTVSLHLSAVAPTLRFDLSDSCLIITQDDPNRVNLFVARDQPLYDYYLTELLHSRDQARTLSLDGAPELSDEPTADEVRALFDHLGLRFEPPLSDPELAGVVDKALRPENPYWR